MSPLLLLPACADPAALVTDDSGAPAPVPDFDAEAFEPLAEELADELISSSRASAVQLAVWEDGALVWSQAWGARSNRDETPISPRTLFQIGSNTKLLTALLALRQVQAGRLDLDAPLSQALPDLHIAQAPGWEDTVSLRQLLHHQGGLWDYTPWDHAPDDGELGARATGVFADRAWPLLPTGTWHNYANPGYSLVGLATEAASGRPYADLLREDLLLPLGLDRSYARYAEVLADGDYALGYGYLETEHRDVFGLFDEASTYDAGLVDETGHTDNAFLRPAGGVFSTAEQLAALVGRLLQADPDLLGPELAALVSEDRVPVIPHYEDLAYGLGLFVNPTRFIEPGGRIVSAPRWSHGGLTLDFSSEVQVLPEQGLTLVLLANAYGLDLATPATALLLAAGGLEAGEPGSFLDEVGPLSGYTGTLVDDRQLGELQITESLGALRVSAPDLDRMAVNYGTQLSLYGEGYGSWTLAGFPYELFWVDQGTTRYLLSRNFSFVGSVPAGPPSE